MAGLMGAEVLGAKLLEAIFPAEVKNGRNRRSGFLSGCGALASAVLGLGVSQAHAQESDINLQPAVTEVMSEIHGFHDFLLWIIIPISLLVLLLLVWVMVFFNRRANATPKTFTHNMTVEVIWTVIPVLILVAIAWKSFPILFKEEQIPQSELTLKVIGNSWNWTYEYPDMDVSFTSVPLSEEDALAQGRPYLLAVDQPLYVPEDTTVEVLVTSSGVIHSFAVPAFGVKEDAIQGRVNTSWFRVDSDRLGDQRTFYGQCSELCGIDHSFMPIEIRVVSRQEFNEWVEQQGGTPTLAAAPSNQLAAHASAAAR